MKKLRAERSSTRLWVIESQFDGRESWALGILSGQRCFTTRTSAADYLKILKRLRSEDGFRIREYGRLVK